MNNKPVGLIEFFSSINVWQPKKNRWLAQTMERDKQIFLNRQKNGTIKPKPDPFLELGRKA